MIYCCERFKEELQDCDAGEYAGLALSDDGTWDALECPGCATLTGIKFCPFCGKNIMRQQPDLLPSPSVTPTLP